MFDERQRGDHRQPLSANARYASSSAAIHRKVRVVSEGVDPDVDDRLEVGAQRLANLDRPHALHHVTTPLSQSPTTSPPFLTSSQIPPPTASSPRTERHLGRDEVVVEA